MQSTDARTRARCETLSHPVVIKPVLKMAGCDQVQTGRLRVCVCGHVRIKMYFNEWVVW